MSVCHVEHMQIYTVTTVGLHGVAQAPQKEASENKSICMLKYFNYFIMHL